MSDSNAARTDIVGILRLSQTQADASAHKFQTKKSHSSEWLFLNLGAGNETRTRDPDLGKVVLYQLSYSRVLVWRIL